MILAWASPFNFIIYSNIKNSNELYFSHWLWGDTNPLDLTPLWNTMFMFLQLDNRNVIYLPYFFVYGLIGFYQLASVSPVWLK